MSGIEFWNFLFALQPMHDCPRLTRQVFFVGARLISP